MSATEARKEVIRASAGRAMARSYSSKLLQHISSVQSLTYIDKANLPSFVRRDFVEGDKEG